MSQRDSEPMGLRAMAQALRGDPSPLHRLLDLYGPVEIHISLKQDTEDADSGWTGEVRWQGEEWARIHAATRGRALDLIAGYVRAA